MKKLDWSKFDRGVFLVNSLAIVYNPKTKKILVGRRKKDSFVKALDWTFPGGRPAYKKDLKYYLKLEVKKKTNLDVKIKELILARIPKENRKFLLLYYLAEPVNVAKAKAGEKFKEIKWINPKEVKKYFTTSVDPEIMKALRRLK